MIIEIKGILVCYSNGIESLIIQVLLNEKGIPTIGMGQNCKFIKICEFIGSIDREMPFSSFQEMSSLFIQIHSVLE